MNHLGQADLSFVFESQSELFKSVLGIVILVWFCWNGNGRRELAAQIQEMPKRIGAMNLFITTFFSFRCLSSVFQFLRKVCRSSFNLRKVDQQDHHADDQGKVGHARG